MTKSLLYKLRKWLKGTKSQGIWASAAWILTILLFNMSLVSPPHYRSEILNCWSAPLKLKHIICTWIWWWQGQFVSTVFSEGVSVLQLDLNFLMNKTRTLSAEAADAHKTCTNSLHNIVSRSASCSDPLNKKPSVWICSLIGQLMCDVISIFSKWSYIRPHVSL